MSGMNDSSGNDNDRKLLLPSDSFETRFSLRSSPSRSLNRSRGNTGLRQNTISRRRSGYDLENAESDAAFTIVVRKEGSGSEIAGVNDDESAALIDISHEVVNEAVQDAVQDACGQAVQDAVQEAVQDAIQQALEDQVRFDVRANFFTLIAITGVILFWRGIWSLWDKLFGFSMWSEFGSIAAGLVIMITFRLVGVPLLDGLPSG